MRGLQSDAYAVIGFYWVYCIVKKHGSKIVGRLRGMSRKQNGLSYLIRDPQVIMDFNIELVY